MQIPFRGVLAVLLVLQAAAIVHKQPVDEDPMEEADRLASQVEEEVGKNARNAKASAAQAKQAAVVANKVADHSVTVSTHAKSALKHAMTALHEARVQSKGLNSEQTANLQKAEDKLKQATEDAKYGKLKKVESADLKKEAMENQLSKTEVRSQSAELDQMRQDVRKLRQKLAAKKGDAAQDQELADLAAALDKLKKDSAGKTEAQVNDEMKAEIERLREQTAKYEADKIAAKIAAEKKNKELMRSKELMRDVKMKALADAKANKASRTAVRDMKAMQKADATPVQEKGIDVDTSMPYGDLEPFGREDTAQELTESSVRESDKMVDQLETAEVAEEKRAVFRALTRLRGAAITSFDGVARSQTGNIDEYNKVHKWRQVHPLHHLADEESDVTKWAFPDNADLLQDSGNSTAIGRKSIAKMVPVVKKVFSSKTGKWESFLVQDSGNSPAIGRKSIAKMVPVVKKRFSSKTGKWD